MDIVFLINTYNRQESCQRLVDALQGQGDIVVLNDGCDYIINGCEQYFLPQHNGKPYYWKTVSTLFSFRGRHKYYFMLPDDFLPKDNMVEDAIRLWWGINDPTKICLNLFADRIGCSCWTNFSPRDRGDVWLTQWVDMCFLAEDKFFNNAPVRNMSYWPASRRGIGSGVGAGISRQLHKKGFHLFQVKESLVIPQAEHGISQMHDYTHMPPPRGRREQGGHRNIVFDTRKKR